MNSIRDAFSIDTRAIAIFRVLLGSVVFLNTLLRFKNFDIFYSINGVPPTSYIASNIPEYAFSFYVYAINDEMIFIFLILQVITAIFLIIGYKTKSISFILFLFVVSINYRNLYVTNYGDELLILLLFWSIFLPLGEKWSIDSYLREKQPRKTVFTISSCMILLQIMFMYVVNADMKLPYDWLYTDNAIRSLLNFSYSSYLFADYLIYLPDQILQFMSGGWYVLILFFPVTLILSGKKRSLYILSVMSVHLSIMFMFRIGLFSIVCIAGLVLFVHSGFFDCLELNISRYLDYSSMNIKTVTWNQTINNIQINYRTLFIIANLIVIITGCYMIVSTADTMQQNGDINNNSTLDSFNNTYKKLLINQPNWSFFPEKIDRDLINVAVIETENNKLIDIYDGEVIEKNSKSISNYSINKYFRNANYGLKTYRHRFLYFKVYDSKENNKIRDYYMSYICNKGYKGNKIKNVGLYSIEYNTIRSENLEFDAEAVGIHNCNNNLRNNIVSNVCIDPKSVNM